MEPREIIGNIEQSASLPLGKGDRFAGYAVIGLPFRSGHVLALRRFPASSVGPGYTFIANPQRVWLIDSSHAVVNEMDVGPVGPLNQQASLNEFLIPQRGVFAVARAFLEAPKVRSAQRSGAAWPLPSRSGVSQHKQ